MSKLKPDQIEIVKELADQGEGISNIQRYISDEFEIKLTYLETRFLLEDLKIEIKSDTKNVEENSETETTNELDEESDKSFGSDNDSEFVPEDDIDNSSIDETSNLYQDEINKHDSDVTLTINKLQKPGFIINGTVKFGLDQNATWGLDQLGKINMNLEDSSFKPSEKQMMMFQKKLQDAIRNNN